MEREILIIILLFSSILSKFNRETTDDEQIIANLYYNEEYNNYTLKESKSKDENAIAYAIYNKSYERVGWDFLAISSYDKNDSKYTDEKKAYAMGYLEGYLTQNRIKSFYENMLHLGFSNNNLNIPENLKQFFKANIDYMVKNSLSKKDNDTYWEYVYYIYQQLFGLYNGYKIAANNDKIIEFDEFVILPGLGDVEDVVKYFNINLQPNFEKMNIKDIKRFILLHSHCSALIKLADDFSDIWFGHNTWFVYSSMIRIFKEYRFISNKGKEKSKTISFSSYPGTMSSIDDFYFLESKLLVMETTNSIINKDLYKDIKSNALLCWVRVMLANRLASSSEEWVNIFKEENSGTYNNQFMILDTNRIDFKNEKIPDKTLMIIEQIPGETEINDVTQQLREGYWPSYNVPYSKNFYEKLGYNSAIKLFPDEYIPLLDYENCTRAQIFRRDQKSIKSIDDFKKMLRYNDYQKDNLSINDPSLAIACRDDLKIDGDCVGAIDAKVVSVKELLEGNFFAHIISGPTNDQQPTFSWSNASCYENNKNFFYHQDVVDTWDFEWIDYKIQLFEDINNNKDGENGNNKALIIGVSVGSGVILILVIVLIIILVKSKKSFDRLNEQVNKVSFIGQDKKNENEEKDDDLLE